jgi:hypothetical protein
MRRITMIFLAALVAAVAAGCGSSSSSSSSTPSGQAAAGSSASNTATNTSTGTSTTAPVGALSAEAKSAATGDIPDTQVFLTYHNPSPAWSMSYPEGWTRKGGAGDVTISDKNNIVHATVSTSPAPTVASVTAELNQLKQSNSTLTFTPPQTIQLKSGPAVKASYTTESAPNPVTGKTVVLIVDRYELSQGGKRATIDLGTAKGVDNVDAYRRMINSFTWQ